MLQEGYSSWTRSDFHCFLQANKQFGRDDLDQIIRVVSIRTGKSHSEIEEYANDFWNKCESIPSLQEYVDKIEKEEQRLKRTHSVETMISTLLLDTDLNLLPLNTNAIRGKGYSTENDRFLLRCLSQLGYGHWSLIQNEIQKCRQFQFDWFFRTRSIQDIHRRCDVLVRLVKKHQTRVAKTGRKASKSTKKDTKLN